MGTRALTVYKKNNEVKIAKYSQWDGYPSYLGAELLSAFKEMGKDAISQCVDRATVIAFEGKDKEFIDKVNSTPDWPSVYPLLSRDTNGADILQYLNDPNYGHYGMKFDLDFASDSLFCEWCYFIDFDSNTFEVYKGFNCEPLSEGERFYQEKYEGIKSAVGGVYYPVKLYMVYDLDNLPESIPEPEEE